MGMAPILTILRVGQLSDFHQIGIKTAKPALQKVICSCIAGICQPGIGLISVMVPVPLCLGVNGRDNLLKKHCNCNLYRSNLFNRK